MPDKTRLLGLIENAATSITPLWPLKTFIAANPLAGFEEMPFDKAVAKGAELFGGNGLPTRAMGQKACKDGKIDSSILKSILADDNAEHLFDAMINGTIMKAHTQKAQPKMSTLNALMIKYLAAFLDEGQSAWSMPGRANGFYSAWRDLAKHDDQIKDRSLLKALPEKPLDALLLLLKDVNERDQEALLEKHLAALPGWSGFVKWRAGQGHYPWQRRYPITLGQVLAVRLAMAKMVCDDGLSDHNGVSNAEGLYWLKAWEETYRQSLSDKLKNTWNKAPLTKRPDAQFVFCIDVRSEVFRRHLEATGNYETLGFAGFFGVAIQHTDFGAELAADSCPVLLTPGFKTEDKPCCGHEEDGARHIDGQKTTKGLKETLRGLKTDIAAPFATVEATGALFGLGMIARTFLPVRFKTMARGVRNWLIPAVALEPTVKKTEESAYGLSLAERIFHAEAALKIMGLTENFAPYIFLTGHGSSTENNPYASGLDCGACGGNHGGPNARVMSAVFNDPEVRAGLKERGLNIPEDTVFVAAQHNTTTDVVEVLDRVKLPDAITADLNTARIMANAERCTRFSTEYKPDTRAADWAEVRPEWGLAKNAAFVVGPRAMTQDLNLEGRSFLHSYNWEGDEDGKALEIIMTAPMVVAEWINTQYYFSTLDNAVYGSGSKTTHNVVGKIGVMQGNASDLMSGLPLQSVMSADGALYHEPLRLLTVIKAPLARVSKIITENDILQTLFDNEWVALMVIDPHTGKFMRYQRGKIWHDIDNPNGVYKKPSVKKSENTDTAASLERV